MKPVFFILITFMLLIACSRKQIKLTANNTPFNGLITQSIVFNQKNQQHQWVCFSEIVQQQLTGISCQTDTALPLFSGGLVDGVFEFDYPSRFLLKIQPHHLLAYMKMSLYDDLNYDLTKITVDKNDTAVYIKDRARKINLTITNL